MFYARLLAGESLLEFFASRAIMGRKLDALLGRSFKTSKFNALVNLAISRLAILKNQRQVRCSQARTDVVQLLTLGHQDRALIRVEQVIKEQNMLDAFVMMEGYCHLLIERVSLIEDNKECPDELQEAISSLLFAASRCGEFPELQEIRGVFTSRFGKEFTARAVGLRNNCGVNPKMIQKMSSRHPSLESRMKVLKEIASENKITLHLEETCEEKQEVNQKEKEPKPSSSIDLDDAAIRADKHNFPEKREQDKQFSGSLKARRTYRDVSDAAQAAFESAAHAAAAARAAVELSRSQSGDNDTGNQSSPTRRPKIKPNNEGSSRGRLGTAGNATSEAVDNFASESEDETVDHNKENHLEGETHSSRRAEFERSPSASSLDSAGDTLKEIRLSSDLHRLLEKEIVFDESDDETGNQQSRNSILLKSEFPKARKSNATKEEYLQDEISQKWIPLRSQADPYSLLNRKVDNVAPDGKPVSVRTRGVRGH